MFQSYVLEADSGTQPTFKNYQSIINATTIPDTIIINLEKYKPWKIYKSPRGPEMVNPI